LISHWVSPPNDPLRSSLKRRFGNFRRLARIQLTSTACGRSIREGDGITLLSSASSPMTIFMIGTQTLSASSGLRPSSISMVFTRYMTSPLVVGVPSM
jgi:hypothetical protein